MSIQVKFCGMRRQEDISYANECQPDYIGLVFAESRRQVTAEQAIRLLKRLDPQILSVGVFVNEPLDQILRIQEKAGLSVLQLHGDEDRRYICELRRRCPASVWKAVRVREVQDIKRAESLEVDALLLDSFTSGAYGGTGQTADWTEIQKANISKRFFLAGGLREGNLADAIQTVHPFGVDLSGGIENDGMKDLAKMKAVIEIVRNLS